MPGGPLDTHRADTSGQRSVFDPKLSGPPVPCTCPSGTHTSVLLGGWVGQKRVSDSVYMGRGVSLVPWDRAGSSPSTLRGLSSF